jgi:hypothetical protein
MSDEEDSHYTACPMKSAKFCGVGHTCLYTHMISIPNILDCITYHQYLLSHPHYTACPMNSAKFPVIKDTGNKTINRVNILMAIWIQIFTVISASLPSFQPQPPPPQQYTSSNWQVILYSFFFVRFIKFPGALRHDERTVSKWRIIIHSLLAKFFDGNNIVTADQKHTLRFPDFRCNGPGFDPFLYNVFFTPNKWMNCYLNCNRGPVRHPVYNPFHHPYKKCVISVAKINSHHYGTCHNWHSTLVFLPSLHSING